MKIEIPKLQEDELLLMLEILKADTGLQAPVRPLVKLQKKTLAYIKRNTNTMKGERWAFSWISLQPKNMNERALTNSWRRAQNPLRQVIDEQRDVRLWGCWIPQIALPAKKAKVVISRPEDLAQWFLARAVQNRQHLRFVKCKQCRKFGLRIRAKLNLKYCKDCENLASLEKKSKHYSSEVPKGSVALIRRQQLQRRRKKLGGKLPTSLSIEAHVLDGQKRRPV